GGQWSAEEEEAFKAPVREQYEHQGSPWYATARLWDDGIIDPADTRRVLGLGLSASLNAPIEPARLGVFRMSPGGHAWPTHAYCRSPSPVAASARRPRYLRPRAAAPSC